MNTSKSRILVVRMSAAGDILLCLPAAQALRRHLPGAHVTWLVEEAFAELLEGQPEVDQIAAIPLRAWRRLACRPWGWGGLLGQWRAFRRQMGRARYDLCLDLHGVLRGALLAATVRCDRRLTVHGGRPKLWRRLLAAEPVTTDDPHLAARGLAVAAALGAAVSGPWEPYRVSGEGRDYAAALLEAHDFGCGGPLVALAPATSEASKNWPAERFAALARRLHDGHGARIVLVGGPGDVALCEAISRESGVAALGTAGRTRWPQLAGLLDLCDLLVTGDTGPMHLSAALGRPVVALFGPTTPEVSGPLGEGHVIVELDLPCRPCNPRRACAGVRCMRGISVESVVGAAEEVLGR